MFRPLIAISGVALAAIALAGCGSVAEPTATTEPAAPAADSQISWEAPTDLSGEVTIYSANPQGLTDDLVDEFTAETGVKVNVFAGETGKITAKLDAEWENPQADLVYLASWAPASKYADAGRTLSYQPFGYDSINPAWIGPDDAFIGRDGSALALVVNTNVAEETPADWSDLADPVFQDQVIMPDPRESGTARDLIAAMVSSMGEDATWELFDSLFDNGMVVQGANGPALDDVTAGSHAVVLGGVDYSAYSAIAKGEALEVVLPESGTTISPRPLFILKDAKNVDNAKAFEDFMFSAEGQAISAANNMIPSQPEVAVNDGAKALDDITLLDYDLDDVAADGADVLEQFVERYLNS